MVCLRVVDVLLLILCDDVLLLMMNVFVCFVVGCVFGVVLWIVM